MLFGCIGLVMGLFFLGFCLVGPLWFWSHSRDWISTTATISRCEITSESGQHGPTYHLQLTYEYDFQDRRYRSDRKTFGLAFDEPVADLTAWAVAHPVGSTIECFVDLSDPTEAVLDRTPAVGWVPLALGSLMLGFGVFMFSQLWRIRWMSRNLIGARLTEDCLGLALEGTRTLRVTPSPWLKALGYSVGALALLPLAVWSLSAGIRALWQGRGDIINLLYGAGAGIGAVWLLIQCGKNIGRGRLPRPILRVSPGTPTVGKAMQVEWELPKSPSLQSLSIWLEGAEEAKVRQVTQGYHGAVSEEKTSRSVFAKLPILEEANPESSERASFLLPPTIMHSFRGAKSGIAWHIKVKLGLANGKTIEYAFAVNIQPSRG
ncbi:MAG: DUF3592 domain-containing protein [Verrucomicrobiota bacterium]